MSIPYYSVEKYQSRRSIGYLMRRAGKLVTARIEPLFEQEEVSFVQWVILMHLREGIAMTAAELSQHLCHDSGALTRVIDQMEKRGLVRRKRSTRDRRMVGLELTKEGKRVIATHLPRVLGIYNELLTGFTRADTDKLIELLTRLIDRMSEPSAAEA